MEYQEIDEDNMLVRNFLTPQIIQSQYEIDENNMLVGDFIAMHQANTTRYNATFEIDEEVDTIMVLSAKIDSLAHKIESMLHSVYAMQTKKSTSEIDEDNMLFGDFITGHSNFSWKDNYNNNRPHGPQFQQPKKRTSLKDIFNKFMETTESYIESNNQFTKETKTSFPNQGASIKNLKTKVDQIAVAISCRVPGTFPSNTKVNPKKNVTAITTRSEIQLLEIHVKKPIANK
ncbi:Uncharacterized protein Adt_12845 [Abeliophyllum distichum]|uniref:Uncharacterized protein n=1 Tax=Abeliophyllum distichum TaxID=126358 RepID=A0ABD1URX9_9LAMI